MKAVNGLHRSVLVTRAVNRFTDDSTFIHFVTNSRLSAPEALADCLDLAPQPVFYTPDIPRWTAWKMDFSEGTGTVCLVDEGKLFVIDFDV
ncbi:hypothetical protein FRC03_007701 [Tulasnella sp. 419]|nr:hypothetical protein FRC03_007701 [Tulasnella sp. 419]